MEISDSVLVKQSIEGNRDSFETLVKRYKDNVYNLAYRMTKSSADAEDITQETFLRAYRKLGRYNENYSFRNWILTICSNLTKNIFRKRVRRKEIEENYIEQEYLAEKSQTREKYEFEVALKKLRPDVRAALALKYVEGCSFEDIADILRIGVSAAKMRVKRGRDQLKKYLNKNY